MRVLAEGKKPEPLWVGVWRCQVCGTVIELEDSEEDREEAFECGWRADHSELWDKMCPVCYDLRRPMRRTERPMRGASLGSRMPEPLPSARPQAAGPGFGVPGLTAVAQCFMNCVVGTDAWLKRTVGAPEEVLEWGRKRWGQAGELALHNIGWGVRGLREARANG